MLTTYGRTLNRPCWPANPDRWKDGPNPPARHSCVHHPDVLQPRAKQCALCCSRLTARVQGNSYTDFRNGCRLVNSGLVRWRGYCFHREQPGVLRDIDLRRSRLHCIPLVQDRDFKLSRGRLLSRKSVLDSRPGLPFSSLTERRGFTFWSS